MGQVWTGEMQADLERWQASLNEAEVIAADPIDTERFQLGDILRGFASYCAAVIRHKVLRGARPVWSLADEIDYARFCRRLGESPDPEVEERIEGELDIFAGVVCYRA